MSLYIWNQNITCCDLTLICCDLTLKILGKKNIKSKKNFLGKKFYSNNLLFFQPASAVGRRKKIALSYPPVKKLTHIIERVFPSVLMSTI